MKPIVRAGRGGLDMSKRPTQWILRFFFVMGLAFASSPAFAILTISAGVDGGLGKSQTESTLASRSMTELEVHAMPAWRLRRFGLGVLGQYRWVGQTPAAASVGNSNLRGNGYTLGPAATFHLGRLEFVLSYDFLGKYALTDANTKGDLTSYKNPSGLTLLLSFHMAPQLSLDFIYASHTYSKSTVAGVDTDLGGDAFKESHYGVGVSFHWANFGGNFRGGGGR